MHSYITICLPIFVVAFCDATQNDKGPDVMGTLRGKTVDLRTLCTADYINDHQQPNHACVKMANPICVRDNKTGKLAQFGNECYWVDYCCTTKTEFTFVYKNTCDEYNRVRKATGLGEEEEEEINFEDLQVGSRGNTKYAKNDVFVMFLICITVLLMSNNKVNHLI